MEDFKMSNEVSMFRNAGKKIKGLALFVFTLIVLGGCLSGLGIIYISMEEEIPVGALIGIGVAILFIVWGWLWAILLYSWGEACENIMIIRKKMCGEIDDNSNLMENHKISEDEVNDEEEHCKFCGAVVGEESNYCPRCGTQVNRW